MIFAVKGTFDMKKKYFVILLPMLLLVFSLLFPRFWAQRKALEYLDEKYNKSSEVIFLEDVTFGKPQVNIFRRTYSVLMEYGGVVFLVSDGNDTYTEAYQVKRYTELVRSDGMKDLIGAVSTVMLERPTGAAALEKRDVKFQMWLNFLKVFDTKEEYAVAVRRVLDRLEEAELICCDSLETYGYVGEQYMECALAPMWDQPTDAEILSSVTVSSLGIWPDVY